MRRVLFLFAANDLRSIIKRHKAKWLCILPYMAVGLILGIVLASAVQDNGYISAIAAIVSECYNPFGAFIQYFFMLFLYILSAYFSGASRLFGILFRIASVYMGYIIGRLLFFCIASNWFMGILSLLLFVMPSVVCVVICAFVCFSKLSEWLLCGFNPIKNSKQALWCVKCLLFGTIPLFLINFCIGGLVNLLINII